MKLDDLDGITMTASEAFLAMGEYLMAYAARVSPEAQLATICADVQVEEDRMSRDPAALSDWSKCVQTVLGSK